MKRINIFIILFFITNFLFAQINPKLYDWLIPPIIGGTPPPFVMTYVNIPDAPTFPTSQTVNYVNPGNIVTGTNPNKFLGTSATWEQIRYFSLVGTSITPFQISNLAGSNFVGAFANNYFDSGGAGNDFIYTYGRTAADPFYINMNATSSGGARFLAPSSGPGSTWIWQNLVFNDGGIGYQFNDTGTLSGGTSITPPVSTDNYLSETISFYRVFNMGTEGFYGGITATTAAAIHQGNTFIHCVAAECGWDNAQWNWSNNLSVTKSTFHNGGLLDVAGQNNLLQLQNVIGIVEDNIFHNAPHLFTIASHNVIIRNNYFRWTDGFAGLIQDYYTQYGTCCRLVTTPVQILIENNDFDCENATECDAVFDAIENDANIIVQNNRFENVEAGDIFIQGTGGNRIDGGGNTFVTNGTIPIPTFISTSPTAFETHYLLSNTPGGLYHYLLHRGYRTP